MRKKFRVGGMAHKAVEASGSAVEPGRDTHMAQCRHAQARPACTGSQA